MTYLTVRADARGLPLAAECVSSIVTDPPYEWKFMGRSWDATGVAFDVATWREALRVLKPGGHLVAFGGARTYHRLVCAIEDAGFEIRDSLHWLHGSGMPKGINVSKAIDKAAGAEREVIGKSARHVSGKSDQRTDGLNGSSTFAESIGMGAVLTAPASEAAQQWDGWGTALKPAHEPIVLARKPFNGTVAANVLAHGTGALNVDACRVGSEHRVNNAGGASSLQRVSRVEQGYRNHVTTSVGEASQVTGRWPTNLLLSHPSVVDEYGDVIGDACVDGCVLDCPVAELDTQSGVRTSGMMAAGTVRNSRGGWSGPMPATTGTETYGDTGGASRFFPCFRYQAKAPARERPRIDGVAHPTVKPLALMKWLLQLITPPGGIVLDQFVGSGTTMQAATSLGYRVIGVELDATYLPLIAQRMDQP